MLPLTGAKKMGRFAIQCEVANLGDVLNAREGLLEPAKVRRLTIAGVVDCDATHMVLPLSVVKRLGLKTSGKVKVHYADRRTALRDMVEGVYVEILGRHSPFCGHRRAETPLGSDWSYRVGRPRFACRQHQPTFGSA